jgi:hypothetical protein
MNTIFSYFSKKLTLLKRFLGLDRSNVVGHLYLVDLELVTNRIHPLRPVLSRTSKLSVAVKVTLEETRLNKDRFIKLIEHRAMSKATKLISSCNANSFLACDAKKFNIMKVCDVYNDYGELSV